MDLDQILENEFGVVSDDDTSAFVEIEHRARNLLEKNRDNTWNAEKEYMKSIADAMYLLDVPLIESEIPTIDAKYINEVLEAGAEFAVFLDQVDMVVRRTKLDIFKERRRFIVASVKLSPEAREEIRGLIGEIKRKIDTLDVSDERRDALSTKLSAFALEVERTKTRFAALGSLMLQATSAIGTGYKDVRPIVKDLTSIFKIAGSETEEAKQLAASDPIPQIESPERMNGSTLQTEETDDA